MKWLAGLGRHGYAYSQYNHERRTRSKSLHEAHKKTCLRSAIQTTSQGARIITVKASEGAWQYTQNTQVRTCKAHMSKLLPKHQQADGMRIRCADTHCEPGRSLPLRRHTLRARKKPTVAGDGTQAPMSCPNADDVRACKLKAVTNVPLPPNMWQLSCTIDPNNAANP